MAIPGNGGGGKGARAGGGGGASGPSLLSQANEFRATKGTSGQRQEMAGQARELRTLQQKLKALGPEPRPVSAVAARIAREGTSPYAKGYQDQQKAYASYRRKYLAIKKQEVAASNKLFYARQAVGR